jgi:hypothetical protein
MLVTIKSYPDLNIDFSQDLTNEIDSSRVLKNIWVDVSEAGTDEYIEVTYNGETITLLITDECRYTPIDIAFKNKEGALCILPFFKAQAESLSVTSEEFQSDRGQAIDGFHQYVNFNVQGRTKLKVSSGFVKEEMNEIFKQLFLSEQIWRFDGTNYIPLNISSKSLEYKTRQKDRLINYEVEFDYAFNEINNQ